MEYVIETTSLTKAFPRKVAVNNLSMHVAKGDIYGFIGKNGSGKTTTMKMLLGLLKPTNGSIKLFGSTNLNEARKKIGSLIEEPGLYKNFSAYENMKKFSILYGGTEQEIYKILELVGLADTGKKKVREFSLGMKQRLGIAIALLGRPEILILDEPINGLDPAGIKEIRNTFIKLSEAGVTLVIASHLLDELAKITTRYGIINDGFLIEEVTAEEIHSKCITKVVISVSDPQKAAQLIKESDQFSSCPFQVVRNTLVFQTGFDKAGDINELFVKNDIKVTELYTSSSNFEDYFIERLASR